MQPQAEKRAPGNRSCSISYVNACVALWFTSEFACTCAAFASQPSPKEVGGLQISSEVEARMRTKNKPPQNPWGLKANPKKKSLLKSSLPKNTGQILLPKKIPKSWMSDPNKSCAPPRHFKSGTPPPPWEYQPSPLHWTKVKTTETRNGDSFKII